VESQYRVSPAFVERVQRALAGAEPVGGNEDRSVVKADADTMTASAVLKPEAVVPEVRVARATPTS
jgi:hypothetical protein